MADALSLVSTGAACLALTCLTVSRARARAARLTFETAVLRHYDDGARPGAPCGRPARPARPAPVPAVQFVRPVGGGRRTRREPAAEDRLETTVTRAEAEATAAEATAGAGAAVEAKAGATEAEATEAEATAEAGAAAEAKAGATEAEATAEATAEAGAAAKAKAAVDDACAQILGGQEDCIEIEAEPLTDASADALGQALRKNKTVKELNIYGQSALSDVGIKAICRGLKKKTRVVTLTIQDSQIGDQGATDLARALVSTILAEVDVSFGGRIGDVGAKQFSTELPFTQVRQLTLSKGTIGYDGTSALAEKLPETKITSFTLSEMNVGDTGAAAMAFCLGKCEDLKVLGLQSNGIHDAGAIALAEALPGSALTDLYLRGNDIGDDGARALAEHLHKSHITSLDLKENPRIKVRFTTQNADGAKVHIFW